MPQKRFIELQVELQERKDGSKHIVGSLPYNSRSLPIGTRNGQFVEEIDPGAFVRSLSERDQLALWSHDIGRPLGRKSRGTLQLVNGKDSLAIDITVPDNSWGQDAIVSVQRGDVQGMSFTFDVAPDTGDNWRMEDGVVVRRLLDADLYEVSPVAFPAYPASKSETRGINGDLPDIPAELRGASDSADNADDGSAGALNIQRRRLDLLSIGDRHEHS